MPARDPAATPHLPTGLSKSPNQSMTVLPTHHHSTGHGRSSSSAFSARTTFEPTGDSSIRSRRVSTPAAYDGIVGKFLRRLSHSSSQHDAESSIHEPEEGIADSSFERVIEEEDGEDSAYGASTTSRAIRDSTNRLASMSFSSRASMAQAAPGASAFTVDHRRPIYPSPLVHHDSSDLGISPKTLLTSASPHSGPSGLSMLMERGRRTADSSENSEASSDTVQQPVYSPGESAMSSRLHGPDGRSGALAEVEEAEEEDLGSSSELRMFLERAPDSTQPPSERTPLLRSNKKQSWRQRTAADADAARQRLSKVTATDILQACVMDPIRCLPSVILGLLLNVLDGVSYGMILFPTSVYFPDFGSIGVSMFFVSCIVSQLTFSLGGSIFKAGNGSMMIEAVPFYHIICNAIQTELEGDTAAIVATTMVSFAFSSILTGLVFFGLGAFRLGSLIGYFPRHILVGCIGGVGFFLIQTGFQVALDLPEDSFNLNWASLKLLFESGHAVLLWTIPLGLAILLRVITHFFHHQLVFPVYFFVIPVIFYMVVGIGRLDLNTLRSGHWVFDVGSSSQPWWKFYTYFDFRVVNWRVFWSVMPTQAALVFFGILHVPLNVPALGVSLAEDNVKLDRELLAHGVSNFAAGLAGTVPNYLTYVNSIMFYKVGGGSRLSGLMLAAGTAAILFAGPGMIAYLPVMVVAALIFVLGIDLAIEAVWDTRHRVNRMEYITIWVICLGMTIFDFVIGLLLGIILACIFFVVQSSRRRPIRSVFNGATAKSTVRRPRAQRAFIQRVGSQTYVMKLQGFLFFGTITVVEAEIRKLLDMAEWENNPIRFLIIDFALVGGLDFSSAEAFVRVQRLLAAKDVLLIMCGAQPGTHVDEALQGVDLWADQEGTRVEVFDTLNHALEWTENAYLTAFYESQQRTKGPESRVRSIDLPKISRMPFSLAESFQNSPRRTHLAKAGDDTLPHSRSPERDRSTSSEAKLRRPLQPLAILTQTMGCYTDEDESFFVQLTPYFKQVVMQRGELLWRQGDAADGLYLIQSGSLRATYAYDEHTELVHETMVAGTVAGDLSALSETHRNCTVVAERESILWKLEQSSLARMEKETPEVAGKFVKIILKGKPKRGNHADNTGAVEEVDVLASHLIAVLA